MQRRTNDRHDKVPARALCLRRRRGPPPPSRGLPADQLVLGHRGRGPLCAHGRGGVRLGLTKIYPFNI